MNRTCLVLYNAPRRMKFASTAAKRKALMMSGPATWSARAHDFRSVSQTSWVDKIAVYLKPTFVRDQEYASGKREIAYNDANADKSVNI
jgi:hypothetical protein